MAEARGFWVGRGDPSVVDWCEPNYAVTPYVAEFWNTLSSTPMLLMGLYGLVMCLRSDVVRERRYGWCMAGLALVGLGSMAFHGTLLRLPQALDELPMVYLGLIGAWVVRYRDAPRGDGRSTAILMGLYAVGFTVAYFAVQSYFELFLASYSTLVAYVVIRSVHITWLRPAPVLMSRLLGLAAVGFLGGLTLFWIPEHLLLGCDHPLQALQLHSLWHLGSGLGTYLWFLWAIVDRRRLEGVQTRLVPWFAPFVAPHGAADAIDPAPRPTDGTA